MHCELINKGGIWQLRDLGSDNGTFVNAKQIRQPFNLNSGDQIEFGKHTLRFDQPAPQEEFIVAVEAPELLGRAETSSREPPHHAGSSSSSSP